MVHRARSEGTARAAAEIAALVSQRGLGGSDVDLDERMRQFRRDRGGRADEARVLARRWAGGTGNAGDDPVGRHLARAYPDRIAQAAGRPGRYRLANGRAAALEETEALARSPFLVVTDITGAAGNSRIRAAATIDRAEIEELFTSQIVEETILAFDVASRSVRARRVRRLGEVRLAEAPVAVADFDAAASCFPAAVAGPRCRDALPWTKEQSALRGRAGYLRSTLGAPWPDLSDTALAATVDGWLAPAIESRLALADITSDDLGQALGELLPRSQRSEMEALLPSHFEAPTGERHAIDYGAENGPALSIRVQELFGLDRHPAIAGGRVPLLLVLLSPAHRPIQTTRDLPGFWRGSWADVARDLKGRYPRHPWPDDPAHAAPTTRAKPRRG